MGPPGGNRCVASKNKPNQGRLMEIDGDKIRCDGCKKEQNISDFEFQCDKHSDFKKGALY